MEKKNRAYGKVWLVLAVVVFVAILVIIVNAGKSPEKEKVKVGLILSGSMKEKGWNGLHYNGALKACENLDVELCVKENIKEFSGTCETAIRELAEDGVGMIILSSYGYSEEVFDVVQEYEDIAFYANSSEHYENNLSTYFVRMYQARYLAGVLAGLQTTNNQIGYVAAMSNNEVNRGINAFTMGVKSVNPDAVVNVAWTGSWDEKELEINAANHLIQEKRLM